VQGFDYVDGKVNKTVVGGSNDDRVPMPVKWIYVLQDGTLTTPDAGSGVKAEWGASNLKKPTKENPIVGRVAFWADDDSSKVNINTAAGFVNTQANLPTDYQSRYDLYAGSYWDTPRFYTQFDHGIPDNGFPRAGEPSGGLALTQLLQGEFQRYPGHPATTSLGGIFGAYLTSEQMWRILPRIGTDNYASTASTTSVIASTTVNQSFGTSGGTKRVAVGPVGSGGGSDNQNLLHKTNRLYASVDEVI